MSTTMATKNRGRSDAQRAALLGIDPNTGLPLPKGAAANNRHTPAAQPDLRTALKQLWNTLVGLRGYVDSLAVAKGIAVEVPDEPTGPMFAEPSSPWSTQADTDAFPDAKNPDGNPRGDERIIRRRRMTELEREIIIKRKKAKGAAFADRERWDQELQQLSGELETLQQQERDERLRRNLGTQTTEPAGQQYAEPVSWDAATQREEGTPDLPLLREMSDAEAERLRAESIRLQGIIDDTQGSFTERTKAIRRRQEIESQLRAAGRSIELGRAGGPRPQP